MSISQALARLFAPGRTRVMGIVNVTPDSFSDGGLYLDHDKAIAHGVSLVEAGADIVDVGGESTRPGAHPVDPAEEQARVCPVIKALASRGIDVSVDTMHASTARAAVEAGAILINDVSGGLNDQDMASVAAATGAGICLMHWKTDKFGDASGSAHTASGMVLVDEVVSRVDWLAQHAIRAGVDPSQIVVDPGLGFAKTVADNLALLAGVDRLQALGYPVLIGASRKRFVAAVRTSRSENIERDPEPATAAISAYCAAHGVWAVRVHDAAANRDAVDVITSIGAALENPT